MLASLLAELPYVAAEDHARHVATLILALQSHRFDGDWLSSRRPFKDPRKPGPPLHQVLTKAGICLTPRQKQRLRDCQTLPELLQCFHLKSVPLDCQEGLLGWLEGLYPLDLRLDIPSPQEMLAHQCLGRRFVTFRPEPEMLFVPIGRHAGSLEFALHDLEHAHKFFSDALLMAGQVHFFQHIQKAINDGIFADLQSDSRFSAEFDYLISDMNSHPLHLWKYLKAIVMNACHRRQNWKHGEFIQKLMVFWKWSDALCEAGHRINHPDTESEQDRALVSAYFIQLNGEGAERTSTWPHLNSL